LQNSWVECCTSKFCFGDAMLKANKYNTYEKENYKILLVVFKKQAQVEKYNCAMWRKACQDSRMKSFKLNM
jgi:hypothetical protein